MGRPLNSLSKHYRERTIPTLGIKCLKRRVEGHCPQENYIKILGLFELVSLFGFKLWKKQYIYTTLEKIFQVQKFFQVFSRFFREFFKFQVFSRTFQGRLKIPGFPGFSRCVGTLSGICDSVTQE